MDNLELLNLAEEYAQQGQTEKALKLVEQAIRNDPYDYDAWWGYSQLVGSRQSQRRAVEKVLELRPDHPEALAFYDELKRQSPTATRYAKKYSDVPKNYMRSSVGTLLAYWVFFPAGLLLNLYLLQEARQLRQQTGITQTNVGCLWTVLVVSIVLPVMAIIAVIGASVFYSVAAIAF